jgi:hypothetical protein
MYVCSSLCLCLCLYLSLSIPLSLLLSLSLPLLSLSLVLINTHTHTNTYTQAFVIAIPSSFIPKLVYTYRNDMSISGFAQNSYAKSPVTNGAANEMNCFYKVHRQTQADTQTERERERERERRERRTHTPQRHEHLGLRSEQLCQEPGHQRRRQ